MKQLLAGIIILLFAGFASAGQVVLCLNGEESNPTYISLGEFLTRDVVWDNGAVDEANGLCCQRVGAVPESDVADDFHLDAAVTITGAQWETVDDATYTWDFTDDFEIYADDGGQPSVDPIVQLLEVPNDRVSMGSLFGRPWWQYTIELDPADQFTLDPGDYWVLLRPYCPGTSGQSFWLTSPGSPDSQYESYFRSSYFGYPNWVPGANVFGSPYDVNFILYGTMGGGISCYYPDPPSEVNWGEFVTVEKCYVNDTDEELTFTSTFEVYFRGRLLRSRNVPDVTVGPMSEVCKNYRTKVPRQARNKTFEVCNVGSAGGMDYECCFTVTVNP
jgi:hypothetical protein